MRLHSAFALALSAAIGAVAATIASFAETGRQWRAAGNDLVKDATARKQMVANAATLKKAGLSVTKNTLKQAKKDKDLVTVGTLEGTVKNEELSIDILKTRIRGSTPSGTGGSRALKADNPIGVSGAMASRRSAPMPRL